MSLTPPLDGVGAAQAGGEIKPVSVAFAPCFLTLLNIRLIKPPHRCAAFPARAHVRHHDTGNFLHDRYHHAVAELPVRLGVADRNPAGIGKPQQADGIGVFFIHVV